MKICSKCNIEKTIDLFSKSKTTTWCKLCMNEYAKQYRTKNQDTIKEKSKIWYDTTGRENKKLYDKKMKESIRNYEKNRYHNDPEFRMKKILRTRLYKTMTGQKSSKSIIKFIGIEIGEFKNWIEYQMNEDMSWENYGVYWEIDHVIPCKSFELSNEDQCHKCFHWSNMRPLLKTENMKKSDKVINSSIYNHNQVVKNYMSLMSSTK